jgi:interferon regulatory factor 3
VLEPRGKVLGPQGQGLSHPPHWAEASGAYIPGKDKPDLPTWKRNFRSALNRKEGVRLAEDRSKDPHDPHKIYEFVNPGVNPSPA